MLQVIIEGYIGTVPRFIHEVRQVNPKVKVLHYCLDTYPALHLIKALDVDAYLTNSWKLLPDLVRHPLTWRPTFSASLDLNTFI